MLRPGAAQMVPVWVLLDASHLPLQKANGLAAAEGAAVGAVVWVHTQAMQLAWQPSVTCCALTWLAKMLLDHQALNGQHRPGEYFLKKLHLLGACSWQKRSEAPCCDWAGLVQHSRWAPEAHRRAASRYLHWIQHRMLQLQRPDVLMRLTIHLRLSEKTGAAAGPEGLVCR